MYLFITLAVVLLAILFVVSGTKKGEKKRLTNNKNAANAAKEADDFAPRLLFTDSEAKFFHVLEAAVPADCMVWGKLGLWAVVNSKNAWGKIAQKQLDYVIVKNDACPQVVCAVELDDASHSRRSAQARDAEKNEILNQAGIPLVRVKVQNSYNVDELREMIYQCCCNLGKF